MNQIDVLHIGIKSWPLEADTINNNLRGGGSIKYCDLLINSFPSEIVSHIIAPKTSLEVKDNAHSNIRTYRVSIWGGRKLRTITQNLFSLFYAIKIIKKEKISLIHGHMLTGIAAAYLLGKLFGIPVIATPYSIITTEFSSLVTRFTRIFERKIYSSVDRLVFESSENKSRAMEIIKVPFSNSKIIHTGISIPEKIKKYKTLQSPTERINILYVGRLVNIKKIENVILAINELPDQQKAKVKFDIVGEGEMYTKLKSLVDYHELTNIKLHGYVENIEPFFHDADIFTLVSDMEGLSISLLEAMSYGLACIINNFGVPFASSEVLELQDNSPSSISKSILSLINNPELIRDYGMAARNRIASDFSINAFSRKYFEEYKELTVAD